jgi:hypothetical protein
VNCQRELEKMDQIRGLAARSSMGYSSNITAEWDQDSDSELGDFEVIETEDLEFIPLIETDFSETGEHVKGK